MNSFTDYLALEAERTNISYRQGTIQRIQQEAYQAGLQAGKLQERDYVLQFVIDHEFSGVEITARDVAKELQLRTKFESKRQVDDLINKAKKKV